MSYFLILDVGTTNIKVHAYSEEGKRLKKYEEKSKPKYPKPGWVEQNPKHILDITHKLIDKTIEKIGKPSGIALTNQRSTTILWDKKTGEPLYNMITWQDTRTVDIIKKLSQKSILKIGKTLGKATKNFSKILPFIKDTKRGAYLITLSNIGFGTAHSSMHIKWLMENIPEVKRSIESKRALFGNIDSWIAWNLTGKHITDYTNASATGLFDPFYKKWSENILDMLEIPSYIMPSFISNDTVIGEAEDYEVPFLTMIADKQASLYMSGLSEGDVSLTSGTGAFIDMNVGARPCPGDTGIYPMVALGTKNKTINLLEGAVNSIGSAVDWLIDMGLMENYEEIKKAFKGKSADNIVFIPALSGLNSPYLRPDIKGAAFNITRSTKREDFIISLIKGLAMRCSEVIQALENVSDISVKKVIADGGVSKNDEYLQLIADFSGKKVVRPTNLNGSAYGTFMLAKSVHKGKDVIESWEPPKFEKTFTPQEKKEDAFKEDWNEYMVKLIKES